MQMKKVRYRL